MCVRVRAFCLNFIACKWRQQWLFFALVMRLGKVIHLEMNVMFFRLAQEQAPRLYANPWYL